MLATFGSLVSFFYSRIKGGNKALLTLELNFYINLLMLCIMLSVDDELEDGLPIILCYLFIFAFLIFAWIIDELNDYKTLTIKTNRNSYQEISN